MMWLKSHYTKKFLHKIYNILNLTESKYLIHAEPKLLNILWLGIFCVKLVHFCWPDHILHKSYKSRTKSEAFLEEIENLALILKNTKSKIIFSRFNKNHARKYLATFPGKISWTSCKKILARIPNFYKDTFYWISNISKCTTYIFTE